MINHFTKMALKSLRRFKLHSFINFISLVVGFSCFIAATLFANYTQSFDQHFPDGDRIYNVVQLSTGESAGLPRTPVMSEPASRYLRAAFPEVPLIARATLGGERDVNVDGRIERLSIRYVENGFFEIFPLSMLYGIQSGVNLPPNSSVITEEAAIRLFGTTDVVGEKLVIQNRSEVTIVGVVSRPENPSHLQSPIPFFGSELFAPIEVSEAVVEEQIIASGGDPNADRWSNQGSYVYLKFPPGIAINENEFNERLDQFVTDVIPDEWSDDTTYAIQPINQLVTSQLAFIAGGISIDSILIIAGMLVLLIACLNYSNLVVAQLNLRRQEIGIQRILGSSKIVQVIQYSYESLFFVLLSLGVTLVLFGWLLVLMEELEFVGVSSSMLFAPALWRNITLVVLMIVTITGVYPAVRTSRNLVSLLRPKGGGGYSKYFRSITVGSQFFVSSILMVVAVIMFQQNSVMSDQLDGTDADPKLAVTVPLDSLPIDTDLLVTQISQQPGVESVTQIDRLPWSIGNSTVSLSRSSDLNESTIDFASHNVGYDFPETMDIALEAGRGFQRERTNDLLPQIGSLTTSGGPYSMLIDETTAVALGFDNVNTALGATVYWHLGPPVFSEPRVVQLVIAGALGPQKFQFVDAVGSGIGGHVYFLSPQAANYMMLRISRDNTNSTMQNIENEWRELMPEIPIRMEFADDLFFWDLPAIPNCLNSNRITFNVWVCSGEYWIVRKRNNNYKCSTERSWHSKNNWR